ncbi:MAG: VCBS repeat-containing protein [Gemmatimonadaceae bacterium]|nr:VCBS repeat-containing protein [Gloeobacterales cyanobacterium ES-bin-141]
MTAGDLDRDGDLDLATANGISNSVSVLKNKGNGTFTTAQTIAVGTSPGSITVGDLDGDGDLDLATGNRSSSVSVLKNKGNGIFATAQNFDTYGSYSVTVGDLDGDGDLDLVVLNPGRYYDVYQDPSYVSVLKNDGNGIFAASGSFSVPYSPRSVIVGDLDGDGDLDLATANTGFNDGYYIDIPGSVSALKNDGNGTFATAENFTTEERPFSITVGDLDRDGDLDLATANRDSSYNANTVSVLKNNGNGTFVAPQNFAVEAYPFSIMVGDLDGDGDLDLVTANSGSDNVSVLRNKGNGTFTASQNFAVGDAPRSIAVGDLDKDGDLDLATANTFVDTVSILQSTTPTLQLSPSPNRTNPTPLAGGSVSGNIYVFASGKDSDFLRVRFFLDDPTQSGESFSLELAAPFDFASGTVSTANAFNTRTLTNGQHTITATFARTNGTIRTITSTFTVSN